MNRLDSRVPSPAGGFNASLLLTLLTLGCSPPSVAPREVVRPVKTMVVTTGDTEHVRTFPGTVEASRRVELAFQVPGLLVKLPAMEGQMVAKGDLIAQLRQDEFQARLETLQGQLDQARATLTALRAGERPEERLRRESQVRAAEARLANARAEYERATRLMQGRAGTIARAEFDRMESEYRVAIEDHKSAVQVAELGTIGREEDILANEAEVRSFEARLVEASIQLRDTTLLAPYDGVVAQRFAEEGQNIRANEPVVRFQEIEEIEIAVDVPETVMIADIQTADILEMLAEFNATPGLRFPVQIREVAQVADPTTQTFKVRAVMRAPDGIRILPGMTASVTVTYRRARILDDRVLVPVSAVLKDPAGDQVAWVVGADQAVLRRPVRLGEASGGRVEVVDGLEPGDRIVIAGVTQLRDGMKVRDLGDGLGARSL